MAKDLRDLKLVSEKFKKLQHFFPVIFVLGFIFISILSSQTVQYQKMIVLSALVASSLAAGQMFFFYAKTRNRSQLIIAMYLTCFAFAMWGLKAFFQWQFTH